MDEDNAIFRCFVCTKQVYSNTWANLLMFWRKRLDMTYLNVDVGHGEQKAAIVVCKKDKKWIQSNPIPARAIIQSRINNAS